MTMKATLNYTTKQINSNFLIKVSGTNGDGKKINTLVGVSGAIGLIGESLFSKFIDRAFNGKDDVCVCKLRRGLKMSFYCK